MGYQAGYVSLRNGKGGIRGIMTGLGGRLHFYLGRHVRIGGAGASVQLGYADNGSFVRCGYGGLTLEATAAVNRWRFSAGALAGGGGWHNLHVEDHAPDNAITGILDERATFIVSPLITVERSVTGSISLMLMADYLVGPDLGDRGHLGGPKVHVGVLFGR